MTIPLFPGVVFSATTSNWKDNNLLQKDLITEAFLYYFIGLAINPFWFFDI